jgi:hypothetical protein
MRTDCQLLPNKPHPVFELLLFLVISSVATLILHSEYPEYSSGLVFLGVLIVLLLLKIVALTIEFIKFINELTRPRDEKGTWL